MGNLNVEHRVYLVFNLKLKSDVSLDKAEQWIKERSARYVFELKEEKGVSFEWFLSEDNTEATLIESYTDSDGAKKRLENQTSNIPTVTGATERVILGGIYSPIKKNS